MPPNAENLPPEGVADEACCADSPEPGGDLLDRVRSVARRIVERVRKVTNDIQLDPHRSDRDEGQSPHFPLWL